MLEVVDKNGKVRFVWEDAEPEIKAVCKKCGNKVLVDAITDRGICVDCDLKEQEES